MAGELERYLDNEHLLKMLRSGNEEEQRAEFERMVHNATDNELESWKHRIFSEVAAAKARGEIPEPPSPPVDENDVLARMDNHQYGEFLHSIGINSHVDTTLSESIHHGREKAAQDEFDRRADSYVRRHGDVG